MGSGDERAKPMTQRTTWFRSCMECNSTAPNRSGICPSCEVQHGYRDRLVDDVQPDQRPPLPLRLLETNDG